MDIFQSILFYLKRLRSKDLENVNEYEEEEKDDDEEETNIEAQGIKKIF